MADQLANGTVPTGVDTEMKMEPDTEVDTTDPNPPPQPANDAHPSLQLAESLSAAQAAAVATPSATTSPAAATAPPAAPIVRPEKPVAHGGPTRQYLNHNITPHLLEGMKHLVTYEPEKPLLWLADFLRDRSKEVEG